MYRCLNCGFYVLNWTCGALEHAILLKKNGSWYLRSPWISYNLEVPVMQFYGAFFPNQLYTPCVKTEGLPFFVYYGKLIFVQVEMIYLDVSITCVA